MKTFLGVLSAVVLIAVLSSVAITHYANHEHVLMLSTVKQQSTTTTKEAQLTNELRSSQAQVSSAQQSISQLQVTTKQLCGSLETAKTQLATYKATLTLPATCE